MARGLHRRQDVPLASSPVITRIIGCAIAVHRGTGPGLLESTYAACLTYKLAQTHLRFARQVALPVIFEGVRIDCGYRMDFVIEDTVVIEIKSVEQLLPVHSAQVLTYVKLSGLRHGLLINFNVPRLVDGIRSFVNPNGPPDPALPERCP